MKIREYSLPAGWFPRDPAEVSAQISRFLAKSGGQSRSCASAVSPHAGWYYSGRLASLAVSSLDREAQTLVVLGGHLPPGSPVLCAMEDAALTPFGPMTIDSELRSALQKELACKEDCYRDNTVEVLLPMVRFFFPQAQLVWLRLPAETASYDAGITIAKTAIKLKRKINVLASTDLTHYGVNYGFSPRGSGAAALRWMREVNDANFIKAVESGNAGDVLLRAAGDFSACSAGAVLGAMGFANEAGLGGAKLLEYATSADMDESGVPDSFVGYAAMAFGG
jgi:MEMO1 family protein